MEWIIVCIVLILAFIVYNAVKVCDELEDRENYIEALKETIRIRDEFDGKRRGDGQE